MTTIKKVAATAVAVSALSLPLAAFAAGQLEGGNIYRIKNITQNIDFANPQKANACEDLEYKVRIHNPGPDTLSQVHVQATLDSNVATTHSSLVTLSSADANPQSVTATASLDLSSAQSISYVPGSTQLLDPNNALLQNLPDGITQGGVDVGSVGVSTHQVRFVQFEVKVNCPTPPVTPPTVTPPTVTPATPAALPQTGADEFAGLAGLAGSGAIGYGAMSYRRSKKALADKLRGRK